MPYGRKFVTAKAAEIAKYSATSEEQLEASDVTDSPNSRKTALKKKMLSAGKKDIGFANVVKAVIPPQPKPAPLVPQRPQRHIPYKVTRPGALVHERPEKGSRRVSKLSNNARIYINTKRADRTRNELYWFKASDGWIPGTTEGGQRIIEPTFENASPVNVTIVNTSFAEPPPPGFWESVFFFIGSRLVRNKLYWLAHIPHRICS